MKHLTEKREDNYDYIHGVPKVFVMYFTRC